MAKKKSLGKKVAVGVGKGLLWTAKGAGKLAWKGTKAVVKKSKEAKANKPATKSPAEYHPLSLVNTVKGNFDDFTSRIYNDSMIILVAGRRGSGKSVLGFRLLENVQAQTKRNCYALGPKQSVLPSWIKSIDAMEDAANKSIILVDEGALAFSSRDSMSKQNKELGKLLAIARHKDLTLILITQNTGMIDKNVLSLCDMLVFKEGSLLQERMERSAIKDLYETANQSLNKIPSSERKSHCYIIESGFEGVCSVGLPSFWNTNVSKSFG